MPFELMFSQCLFVDNKELEDLQDLRSFFFFFLLHLHVNAFLIKAPKKNIFQTGFCLGYFTSNREDNG